MNYNVRVDVNLGNMQQQVAAFMLQKLPIAISLVTEHGASMWQQQITKAKLPPYLKARYVDSIHWHMLTPLAGEIWSDYAEANAIERGRPARDMKRALQTSKRTRVVGKGGQHPGAKYLIIPMRHNVPGSSALAPSMPADVYAKAKVLSASVVRGSSTRLSGSGHSVHQALYAWGGRLPAGLAEKKKPWHKTYIYAGMVRMNTSAGGGKSSAYLTFRVMGEWSTGWIYPAQPGLHIVERVSAGLQPILDDSVKHVLMSA